MADGILKVGQIQTSSGSGTITIGQSGETVNIPSGTTLSGAGANTPAFEAHLSGNQSISDNTITKVQCNTEIYDTGAMYDNSTNYRFTPTVAGKYFVYGTICSFAGDAANELNMSRVYIYKNGSIYKDQYSDYSGSPIYSKADFSGTVVDMNGSTDYVELYGQVDGINPGSEQYLASDKNTAFGAYKIIGA